jgi:hypothetical protein
MLVRVGPVDAHGLDSGGKFKSFARHYHCNITDVVLNIGFVFLRYEHVAYLKRKFICFVQIVCIRVYSRVLSPIQVARIVVLLVVLAHSNFEIFIRFQPPRLGGLSYAMCSCKLES